MNKNIGVWIQAILTALIVIFLIINFFVPVLLILEILFILTLLVMSYNNYKIYKRKGFTILYIVAAILVLLGMLYG
ncbi:MAG: hypothetical protein MR388_00540 [Tenericutes bacterium]|nr:hypothetical protein [Mycoplasmatota bacterium]